MDYASHLLQPGLNSFILHGDVFINCLRFHTVMILALPAELPAAFGTFPHEERLPVQSSGSRP
jgi:hypothetical protein